VANVLRPAPGFRKGTSDNSRSARQCRGLLLSGRLPRRPTFVPEIQTSPRDFTFSMGTVRVAQPQG